MKINDIKGRNLDEFLNSKYMYEMNTEKYRQAILNDIENQYMYNIDLLYENQKNISEQIQKAKLVYYTMLVKQSYYDMETQNKLISNMAAKIFSK